MENLLSSLDTVSNTVSNLELVDQQGVCPLCNSVVKFIFINFSEKLLMCENANCDFPFGYEQLKIINTENELQPINDISGGLNSVTGSMISTAAWSELDKLNRIYDSEDNACDGRLSSISKNDKNKSRMKIRRKQEEINKNLESIKQLNSEWNQLQGGVKESNINNEHWLKNLMSLQGMSGRQLLKEEEIKKLKKNEPAIGYGELKININSDVNNGSVINIQFRNDAVEEQDKMETNNKECAKPIEIDLTDENDMIEKSSIIDKNEGQQQIDTTQQKNNITDTQSHVDLNNIKVKESNNAIIRIVKPSEIILTNKFKKELLSPVKNESRNQTNISGSHIQLEENSSSIKILESIVLTKGKYDMEVKSNKNDVEKPPVIVIVDEIDDESSKETDVQEFNYSIVNLPDGTEGNDEVSLDSGDTCNEMQCEIIEESTDPVAEILSEESINNSEGNDVLGNESLLSGSVMELLLDGNGEIIRSIEANNVMVFDEAEELPVSAKVQEETFEILTSNGVETKEGSKCSVIGIEILEDSQEASSETIIYDNINTLQLENLDLSDKIEKIMTSQENEEKSEIAEYNAIVANILQRESVQMREHIELIPVTNVEGTNVILHGITRDTENYDSSTETDYETEPVLLGFAKANEIKNKSFKLQKEYDTVEKTEIVKMIIVEETRDNASVTSIKIEDDANDVSANTIKKNKMKQTPPKRSSPRIKAKNDNSDEQEHRTITRVTRSSARKSLTSIIS